MLLNLAFASHVKLHSIAIQAPGNAGPKTVKLFANITRPLDFDSAESTAATQELKLVTIPTVFLRMITKFLEMLTGSSL